MGDSSESEEFYDAEEFTPIKGSKRSSICKNISVTEKHDANSQEKEKERKEKSGDEIKSAEVDTVDSAACAQKIAKIEDDKTIVKNVVQGRRRFQELRRCMQTDEDEEDNIVDPSGSIDKQSFNLEQPFKIISHDTMSLQSMTSLGRIGRILSGAAESHPNIRASENYQQPSASSREPSTISDDPITLVDNRNQNVLATVEPDVIASTKANSLKQIRGSAAAIVAVSGSNTLCTEPRPASVAGPVAPPRKKKRNKLHGSQSLSTTDGDNLSVCTTDTDDYRYIPRTIDKPQLESLLVEATSSNAANQSMALPSPASTIESLTREFQDSLELSQSKYNARDFQDSIDLSQTKYGNDWGINSKHLSRASSSRSDANISVKDLSVISQGSRVVAAEDERTRGGSRTHSESRTAPTGLPHQNNRRSQSDSVGGSSRRRSAGDEQLQIPLRGGSGDVLTDMQILEQVTVLNLDTGERMPLSVAEHKLPQCINPLSLHIMRITSEFIGRAGDDENTSAGTAEVSWRKRLSVSLQRRRLSLANHAASSLSVNSRFTWTRHTLYLILFRIIMG